LAHDAEERLILCGAVVAQLTLDISLTTTFSSIHLSFSAWFHVSKYKQNESSYTRNGKYSLHIQYRAYLNPMFNPTIVTTSACAM
jgi:hypothetical protein